MTTSAKRARRGTRGGRGRSRSKSQETATEAAEATEEAVSEPAPEPNGASPAAPAAEEPKPEAKKAAPRSRRTSRAKKAETEAPAEPEAPEAPAEEPAEEPAKKPARARATSKTAKTSAAKTTKPSAADERTQILEALDRQGQQIKEMADLQADILRTVSNSVSAPAARVGVFVDAANVELAADRLRNRFDWGKVLQRLTKDRQLVKAIAYSPVHDDPSVSRETQRFVEPFLDKGYKIVTKSLKRFSDGTIKANVDIEMTLDIITMVDRLDVVCLVSGDGDFEPLVEAVQQRGVRVEVVSVGQATANNLRNAADRFVDLATIIKEIRA